MSVAALDKTDLKILSILQEDSRKSYSDVAKKLGLSETAVRNRVGNLVKKGVVKKFSLVLDADKIGRPVMAVIGIVGDIGPVASSRLVEFEEVTDAYTVTGDFNLIVKVLCRDIKHLDQTIEKMRSLGSAIETRSHVVLKKVKEAGNIVL